MSFKETELLSIVVTVQTRRFLAATAVFVVNPHPKIFCTKICKGERNANFKMHSLLFSLAITGGEIYELRAVECIF